MDKTAGTLQKVTEVVLEAASGTSRFNLTSAELKRDPDSLAEVELLLEERGVRSVSFVGRGNVAIVMDAVNNQLIRISPPNVDETRFDLPEILQPIMSFTTEKGYRIEVMPRVRTGEGEVTYEQIEALRVSLARKGYVFDDVKAENVGVLEDGTPVVLDGGAVITEEAYRKRMQDYRTVALEAPSAMNRNYVEKLDAQVEQYNQMQQSRDVLPFQWEGAQERHLQALGLEKGTLKGVIDAHQLDGLKRDLGMDNLLVNALDAGFYPSQLPSQLRDVLVDRGMMEENATQRQGGYANSVSRSRTTTYSGYNGGH